MNWAEKRVLVTGGAVRLGRAISERLLEKGARVVVHYGESEGAAKELKALWPEKVHLFQADLSDPGAVDALIPRIVSEQGPLDGLINCAGIFLDGGLGDTTRADWDRQHAINLRAPFFLLQAFMAQVSDGREGAVVNIVDARAGHPGTDHMAYRLTKDALLTLTRHAALAAAPQVRVNAVGPGAVLPAPGGSEEDLRRLAEDLVPLGRPGGADVVVRAVLECLENDFLNGVFIPVDGGQFL